MLSYIIQRWELIGKGGSSLLYRFMCDQLFRNILYDQLYCLVPLFSVRGKVESACTGSSSPSVFLFFSAAFPLGGASIRILEHPYAFGVFECPHLYWARKNFAIVQCESIIISKQLFY